jgi:hypothetical protein
MEEIRVLVGVGTLPFVPMRQNGRPMSALGQKHTSDWRPLMSALAPKADIVRRQSHVRFSIRPVRVKRFQTIHHNSVDVAREHTLLFEIGTKAPPSWGSENEVEHSKWRPCLLVRLPTSKQIGQSFSPCF